MRQWRGSGLTLSTDYWLNRDRDGGFPADFDCTPFGKQVPVCPGQ